jgi:hypothetical protein
MKEAESDVSVWKHVRTVADRYIRVCTWILCLLTVPAAILILLPSILIGAAAPITAPIRIKTTLSLIFLDKAGRIIGRQGPVAGQYVRLAQMPPYLQPTSGCFIAPEEF